MRRPPKSGTWRALRFLGFLHALRTCQMGRGRTRLSEMQLLARLQIRSGFLDSVVGVEACRQISAGEKDLGRRCSEQGPPKIRGKARLAAKGLAPRVSKGGSNRWAIEAD